MATPMGFGAVLAANETRYVLGVLSGCCNRRLHEKGREGGVLKATAERWFPGHGYGVYEAPGVPYSGSPAPGESG